MANIEPYQYQKRTNIEEHNDLVSKINEIVDVINQTNIETILPKISKLEADVSAINDTDNVQNTDINNLKEKDNQIDNRLTLDENNIDGITKSLVSDVVLMNGTTTGNMKARIGRENAPSIDSNDYNIQKPVSVELVQGSASAMVKAKITLSDGTVLISDDFMFTTEAIGTDVYISSFVFKNGNVAGTISADIGLSNGSTLEANNFVVPTDPNVISSISDLQSRMTAVENSSGELTELKNTVDGHTSSINNLKTDKADVNNSNQSITAGTVNANNINKGGIAVATVNDIPDISGKVNIAQGIENAGKVLGIGSDGNVTPVDTGNSGEVWEEVDLSNFPTDWAIGDRIKLVPKLWNDNKVSASSWTSQISYGTPSAYNAGNVVHEVILNNNDSSTDIIVNMNPTSTNFRISKMSFTQQPNVLNIGGSNPIGSYQFTVFNGAHCYNIFDSYIYVNNLTNFISKMWRCRTST